MVFYPTGDEHRCPCLHHGVVLYGDMVIAHSLVEELGSRRTNSILVLLEHPELELAPSDQEALERFIERLSEQYGPENGAVRQLRSVLRDRGPCP